MDSMELKSNSQWWDSHISPENPKWLVENLAAFDQSAKEVLKLIEQVGNASENTADMFNIKTPELKTQIAEFSRMHHMLAERCECLIEGLRRNSPSLIKQQHVDISDSSSPQVSHMLTPDQMSTVHKYRTPIGFDVLLGSGGGGSDVSQREGSESSFSSSSDSDSESFNSLNKLLISPVNNDGSKAKETKGTEMLLRKIADYEEELIIMNKKLQNLEEENANLKHKLKENESVNILTSNLQAQLELAQHDTENQNSLLEMEKTKVIQLQKQVDELKLVICDSDIKIGTMEEESESIKKKLKHSEEEIAELKVELSSKIYEGTRELQAQLDSTQRDMNLLERQLYSEKKKVLDLEEEISVFVADISVRDDQIEQLRTEIKQSKSEISTMKEMHEAKEESWQADSERLKVEIRGKSDDIEVLNKNLDTLKQKYDMLMSEKDGVNAQLNTLRAEMSSLDNISRGLEDRLSELQAEHVRVKGSFDSTNQLTSELRLRVEELEGEVDRQREVISDRAEEKREAIRQLCFSLEHYKTGYKELCRALIAQKRHGVLSS